MKMEKLVGDRFKERPSDCVIDSHALMLRGGYMKQVGSGIFSLYPPLRRITQKIEKIIREEMDAVDGQEVLFPVTLPGSLWEESGRYQSVGSELLRFTDRNNAPMLLGMTHEEAAVHLVREYGNSYLKYPFMIYQIQTKFRDEARPRGGLIRVREFTMKDAYSFHLTQEDLESYYERCFAAYERIFRRAGLKNFITVASDSGMMGGKVSHEYMLLTPVGEDTIVLCGDCGYRANMEAAESLVRSERDGQSALLALTHTPGMQTIADVCDFLHSPTEKSCKAVIYQKASDDSYVVVFLRGDLELNEAKLTRLLGEAAYPAVITPESGLTPGYIGPYALSEGHTVLIDCSLQGANNIACGANREEYHYTGLDMDRDCPGVEYHDLAKAVEGGICPKCGKSSLSVQRGIEVGNIFQLGTKYTEAMNMQYLDGEGQLRYPVMGCYGIGVGRLAAAVCEESHDEYGPVWPLSIAPWQVHITCMRADQPECRAFGDKLYHELLDVGIEVIYDDRAVSAGVMFSDADLLGVPVRVVVSPRNMKEGCCELSLRDKSMQKKVPANEITAEIQKLLQNLKG